MDILFSRSGRCWHLLRRLTSLGQAAGGCYAEHCCNRLCGYLQALPCSEAPSTHWACLPVDVIGHVIGHMHHTTLEALSQVNVHWRAAVKVRTMPLTSEHEYRIITLYRLLYPSVHCLRSSKECAC